MNDQAPVHRPGLIGSLLVGVAHAKALQLIAAARWRWLQSDGPTPLDAGADPNLRLALDA